MGTLWRALCDWLTEKLGHHVCREFTQWEVYTIERERRLEPADGMAYYLAVQTGTHSTDTVKFTDVYQERRCTLCGKVEQRPLAY